SSIAPPPGLSG
nr:Chain L, Branchpoint-bridging protein [synthetic construct]3FMA_M Chain M, Branchpoint-bridging protein [synthetic construct]3FMA_N Chain N, Branchpoint-bridging protein [synthetic construct]3FMA_O Chain O, Branchpoint-bridging protein [synthetic construct]3FMA_P Chain P, Branchpoint-bridging protein [synthetic construct]